MIDIAISPMFLVIVSSFLSMELLINKMLTGSYETDSFYSAFRKASAIIISIGLKCAMEVLDILAIIAVFLSVSSLIVLLAVTYSIEETKGKALLVASILSFVVSFVNLFVGASVGVLVLIIYPRLRGSRQSGGKTKLGIPQIDFRFVFLLCATNIIFMIILVYGILV